MEPDTTIEVNPRSGNLQKILTRDFVLCFFAQFAFTSVFHILIPTLPIYLSRSGSTEVEIGILVGVLGISSLIFRPLIGKALLRIPEKRFMIFGAILMTISSAAYLWVSSFWLLLIVRVVQGISLAFFYTSSITLIANISPEEHRGRSISYFYLAFNISFALSPSLGMLLINHFNFTALFLACIGLSLCSLFIADKLRPRMMAPLKNRPPEEDSFFSRKALSPSIVVFFVHMIWGTLTAFFPLYALKQGVENPGLFFASYAIVIILGRALGGRILDITNREKIILPCMTTYIISMTILSFSKTLPMFILVGMIWGIGNAFLLPSIVAELLDRVGPARGPAMGTFTAISDLGIGIGPVIMGVILRFTDYPTMFLFLAFTGLINLNYFFFFMRKRTEARCPSTE